MERTFGVELLAQNIASLHFKTERVAGPPYANRDFEKLWLDFPELQGYLPVAGTLN